MISDGGDRWSVELDVGDLGEDIFDTTQGEGNFVVSSNVWYPLFHLGTGLG